MIMRKYAEVASALKRWLPPYLSITQDRVIHGDRALTCDHDLVYCNDVTDVVHA